MTARRPLREPERTGANRGLQCLAIGRLQLFENMLRHDRRFRTRLRGNQKRRRFGQHDNGGQGIRRLHRLDVLVGNAAARMGFLQTENRKGNVFRGEILTVMPFHIRPEFERIAQVIIRNGPFRCQQGPRIEVEIEC
ncbi:hypothetical protein D3C78_1155400 [compost metagenome]